VTNKRRITAADFFKGMYETALAPTNHRCGVVPGPEKAAYVKFPIRRRALRWSGLSSRKE
jgi:carbon-monoxide dehydrogenase medium subunit